MSARPHSECEPLRDVLRTLFDDGGSLIDSSPMYGKEEAVVSDLLDDPGMRAKAFTATKVWTRGREAGIARKTRSIDDAEKIAAVEGLDILHVGMQDLSMEHDISGPLGHPILASALEKVARACRTIARYSG
jgi:diketogulonate reductase-like aldo/keto reductase